MTRLPPDGVERTDPVIREWGEFDHLGLRHIVVVADTETSAYQIDLEVDDDREYVEMRLSEEREQEFDEDYRECLE